MPKCEACGQPAYCIHHWIYKSHSNYLRWKKENGVGICKKCHFLIHNVPDSPVRSAILKRRGLEWDLQLQEDRNTYFKMNKSSILSIIDELNEEET